MLKKTVIFLAVIVFFSCNDESKKNKVKTNDSIKIEKQVKTSKFESELLDLREVKENFNPDLEVEKFAMKKFSDSIYGFVFKLSDNITNEMIKRYSFGIRGYSQRYQKPYLESFSPELSVIEGNKYLVLKRKIENIRYFDSLDVYIYERKNWKESGRLGEIMIRDVLFE